MMEDYDYMTNGWYNDNNDSLIDYVWLYKGASLSSGALHDSNGMGNCTASDHKMVVADFEFYWCF
eukprot:6384940-Ditylum_brightwellii.AAC.1